MLKSLFNLPVFLVVASFINLGEVLHAEKPTQSDTNLKAGWSMEHHHALLGQPLSPPANTCEVYYFRDGTTACHDSYGWYIRFPNRRNSMAYGSNFKRDEVFYREGLSLADVIKYDKPHACECSR